TYTLPSFPTLRSSDLVHYFEWMLSSLPQDFLLHQKLTSIDIQFKSECRLNDELTTEFQQLSPEEIIHVIKEKQTGREVARAVSRSEEHTSELQSREDL